MKCPRMEIMVTPKNTNRLKRTSPISYRHLGWNHISKSSRLLEKVLIFWNVQRRRQDFFGGGGLPGQLKAITRPPQGVTHFKTIQCMRKWIFLKISTFFLPEKAIFSKKNYKKLNIYYKSFWIFRKIILQLSIFMEWPYKAKENSDEFYYLVEKFLSKKIKNGSSPEGLLETGWKILKISEKIDWNL